VNAGEACTAVQARGFDYLPTPRLMLMLNTAKDEFEDLWEWPWLWATATGATPLTVDDLKLVLTVQGGGNELMGLDLRQVTQDGSLPTTPGTPTYWWIEGTNILHAWPGDGADVSLVYIADSPTLVEPSDTPLIPARYHGLWIDLAVCEAYKDSDNFAASQALRADAMTRIQDVIGRFEVRNRQHSPLISQRGFSEDE
jgi:hypothetical protein